MFRLDNDKNYDVLFAENEFITSLQLEIERAMLDCDMTQTELARAMNVSESRVSQILGGNGTNLQARTIARLADILGLRACVEFRERESVDECAEAAESSNHVFRAWKHPREAQAYDWNQIANDDERALAA